MELIRGCQRGRDDGWNTVTMAQLPRTPRLSVVIPTLGRPILIQTLRSLLATKSARTIEILVVGIIPDPAVEMELRQILARNVEAVSSPSGICDTADDTACDSEALRRRKVVPPGQEAAVGGCRIRHLPVSFERGDSSEKKNVGWRESKADIIAFIDDDVVVAPDWPERILESFADLNVGLVSGPSLVPDDLPRMARLAGVTLASKATGYVSERYVKGHPEPREVKWSRLIGCNMAYRRNVIEEVGGFDPLFWPGEEMIAAFHATQQGHKLMFHPQAYLYHYPRASFWGYVKQIYGYGATRIRLIRGGVDFEPATIIPAVWVLSLAALAVAAPFCRFCAWALGVNVVGYSLAAALVTFDKMLETRRLSDLLMFFLVPVTHLTYGIAEWVEVFRPGKDLSCRRKTIER